MPPVTRSLTTITEIQPVDQSLPPPSGLHSVDADLVVILASLLCAVISIAALAVIARCGCPPRPAAGGAGGGQAQAPPDKGLKKKALRQLPKVSYSRGGLDGAAAAEAAEAAECPICLSEFEEGDQLRLLPQCGHGFHAGCIDAWLRSHSSCPSCRRVLVVVGPPSCSWGRRRADSINAAEPAEAAAAVGGGER